MRIHVHRAEGPQIRMDVTRPTLSESPQPQSLRNWAMNKKTKSCEGCKNTPGSVPLTALYVLFLIRIFIKIIKTQHFWWNQQITTVDERSKTADLIEVLAPCFCLPFPCLGDVDARAELERWWAPHDFDSNGMTFWHNIVVIRMLVRGVKLRWVRVFGVTMKETLLRYVSPMTWTGWI